MSGSHSACQAQPEADAIFDNRDFGVLGGPERYRNPHRHRTANRNAGDGLGLLQALGTGHR